VEENGNYYIFYMRVQTIHVTNYTRYAVLRFDEGCVSTRTTEQTMLKVLGAMLRYIQQNKSSEDIFEIFLKEGYYVDKCVFKFLDLCRSVRLRLDPVIDGAM
jgi:hypothetical protein